MGRFSRTFKKRLLVEQKKALNKIYKKQGLQGLQNLLGEISHEQEEETNEVTKHTSSMDVAEQEGTAVQGQEEGNETEVMPDESQEGDVS